MWQRLFSQSRSRCDNRQPWRRAQLGRTRLATVERLEERLALSLLGQQLFPADNAFNQNISAAPVAANSAAVIANIGASIHIHPDWGDDNPANGNAPLYGIPVNIVHADKLTAVSVIIDNYPDESDIVPVPIPPNAVIEGDYQNGPNNSGGGYKTNQRGDSHLIIYDEDHKLAYELYGVSRPNDPTLFPDDNGNEAVKTDTAWHAAQETVWNMTTNEYRALGATSADAAGLSILAGLARPDEGRTVAQGGQGVITHALRLTLPSSVINPQYIYPASHIVNDLQASNKVPFGARLRLANNSAVNMLIQNMPAESQIVARAMQQYGLIVADIGSAMYVTGASSTTDNVDSPTFKQVWDTSDIFASNGLKVLTAADFEVVDLTPRVTGLSASSAAPGSTITILGQNFSGAGGRLNVFFGGTQVNQTAITVVSDSQIRVVIPPGGSGTVDVVVQSGVVESGSNTSANATNPIYGYGKSTTSAADHFTFIAAGSTGLTWNGAASGNWTDATWTGTSALPHPDANVNAVIQSASSVAVTSPQAAYSLAASGGQITISAGASLTVTTNTNISGGAILNVAGNGSFSTGAILTLDSGGALSGGSISAAAFQLNAGTASANLSGPGGLTKATNGTVTISGSNTYTGPTTVSAGTLTIARSAALPTTTSLIIGGTSQAHATVILAATDANGNPLDALAAAPLAPSDDKATATSAPLTTALIARNAHVSTRFGTAAATIANGTVSGAPPAVATDGRNEHHAPASSMTDIDVRRSAFWSSDRLSIIDLLLAEFVQNSRRQF